MTNHDAARLNDWLTREFHEDHRLGDALDPALASYRLPDGTLRFTWEDGTPQLYVTPWSAIICAACARSAEDDGHPQDVEAAICTPTFAAPEWCAVCEYDLTPAILTALFD